MTLNNIKLVPAFHEIYDLTKPRYSIYALSGGRGGCKSFHTTQSVLVAGSPMEGRENKKLSIVCLREIQETIEKSLYTEFVSKIDNFFRAYGWRYNKERIWNVKTGSEIKFSGMMDRNTSSLEGLKGFSNVDIFVIDEAQSISKASLKYFLPLLRKQGCITLFLFNRTRRDLPIWEELNLDNPEPYVYYLETTYLDNPYIDDLFIKIAEAKRKNKPDEYDTEYMNIPADMAGNTMTKYFKDCYKSSCPDKKCSQCNESNVKKVNYIPTLPLYIGCDFNVGQMCWTLFHKTENNLFYFKEFILENTNTRESIKELIRQYPDHKGDIIIMGDASGDYRDTASTLTDYKIMLQELTQHGYKAEELIHRGNTAITNRVNAWNDRIMDTFGIRHVFIDRDMKWTLHAIKNYCWKLGTMIPDKPTRNQINTNPDLRFMEHVFDSITYPPEYFYYIR